MTTQKTSFWLKARQHLLFVVGAVILWGALVEWEQSSWPIAVCAILGAWVTRVCLSPLHCVRLRVVGCIQFAPYFVWQSLVGGWDVARLAFRSDMALCEKELDYTTTLPAGAPRILFANCTSLLPGTLTMQLDDDILRIHTITADADVETGLRDLERRVSRCFAAFSSGGAA